MDKDIDNINDDIQKEIVEKKPKRNKLVDALNNAIDNEPKKKKSKKDSDPGMDDDFTKSFEAFMKKEGKIDIEKLSEKETVPYFIDTGSYVMNWIISNDMINGGYPGTKLSLVVGECLGGENKLTLQVTDEFAQFLKEKNLIVGE